MPPAVPSNSAPASATHGAVHTPGTVSVFRNLLHHHVHQSSAGPATTFWTGLGAVRRDAFLAVEGFDPDQRWLEDVDLGIRLSARGARIVLDPAVQGTHLKHWSLWEMVRTDFAAIPWVDLMLRHRGTSTELNLAWRHRASAAVSVVAAASILRRKPRIAVSALAALVALNAPFYRLLLQRRGPIEAAVGVPLHAVHHVTGALALMLQTDPSLTPSKARLALRRQARVDTFTGAVPNATYGYGKLDLVMGGATGIDEAAISRFAFAPHPSGSAVPVLRRPATTSVASVLWTRGSSSKPGLAQLPARGLDPVGVRWIVLSHLHTDHIGNVAAFGQAEVVVTRVEWERAEELIRGHLRGYIPHRWPTGVRPRTVDFDGPAVGPFPSSHDLAGDGSLVLVPLPGHTPGHLGMLVRGDAVNALLAGDAAHTRAELNAAAPELGVWCERERIDVLLTHDADTRG
jgi:glyoxylase-like metal-dependent hydrolase (beta-lactamase superfamily II)